jgi:cytochrome c biogenesis protein CcmG/thiol:disulfide interchange protein DsbE
MAPDPDEHAPQDEPPVDEAAEPPADRGGRRRLLGLAATVAVVGVLLGLLGWQVASRDKAQAVPADIAAGSRPSAPDFELPRLDEDGVLRLSSLRGSPVVVNFWASWCVPCRDEAPLLQSAWERYRDQGLVVLGVDSEDFTDDARAFMARYGLTFPNVRDGEADVKSDFGLLGYPETFFVDREGGLVHHVPGPVTAVTLERGIQAILEP